MTEISYNKQMIISVLGNDRFFKVQFKIENVNCVRSKIIIKEKG